MCDVCWLIGKDILLFYVQEFPIGVLNQDSRLLSSTEGLPRKIVITHTCWKGVEAWNIVRIISNKRR